MTTTQAEQNPISNLQVSYPMTLVGYDVDVANAHGFEIRLVDGKQVSVKVSDTPTDQPDIGSSAAALEPVVTGDCGVSFLYYAAQGGLQAQVYTGFDIYWWPVVDFTWKVSVTDNLGVGTREWTGSAMNQSWDTYWGTSHGTAGYSSATVTTGMAVLSNGGVCYTGHPGQSTNLY